MRRSRHDRRAEARANGQTPDPLPIYMQAERFRIADHVLRSDQILLQYGPSVGAPTLVLAAFASELFFKCLFVIETGRPAPEIHELRKLFLLLSDAARAEIEQNWNQYNLMPQRITMYEAIERRAGRPIPRDLRWSLRAGTDAFTALRYAHEEQHSNTTFFLGDLHMMVREAILIRRPQWGLLGHAPAKDITPQKDQ
jgi:hypothetical protein